MANAVVGDFGDVIRIPTGQTDGVTTAAASGELYMYITKPKLELLTKVKADGVYHDGSGVIAYVIEEGVLDQAGTYRFSCAYSTDDGVFSQGSYDTYEVVARNQSQ